MVAVTEGPKEGETIRPRDCWLSNVSIRSPLPALFLLLTEKLERDVDC